MSKRAKAQTPPYRGCGSRNRGACNPPRDLSRIHTLQDVVSHYENNFKANVDESRQCWMATTFDAALEEAGKARDVPNGNHHDHLRTLPKASLWAGAEHVRHVKHDISEASSFEELHSICEKISEGIKGLGEMWAYDTALHIALSLDLHPTYVYLHRGARTGAKRLTRRSLRSVKYLEPDELPEPLSSLPPDEIEDCLCIYKDTPAFRQMAQESIAS